MTDHKQNTMSRQSAIEAPAAQAHPMQRIILSADGALQLCLVPEEVAADLPGWADRFQDWMRTAPEASCFRRVFPSGSIGLCYNEEDFIAWLAETVFPDSPARVLETLGFIHPLRLPEPLRSLPRYNF